MRKPFAQFVLAILMVAAFSMPARSDMPMTTTGPLARQHHQVSTSSDTAQHYFDQGLTLMYSFNRVAARAAFQSAVKADPSLAMGYWGIALSYGPNINVPIDAAGEKSGFAAITKAQALASGGTDEERAYISALATRYSNAAKPNFDSLSVAYHSAMRDMVAKYPDDLDAATLYAESGMDLRPWDLYTTAGVPHPGTAEIVSTLESVLDRDPMHIGANHFYIHATEASLHPERALISATRLSDMHFEPAAAHLVHMPAHCFARSGDFSAALDSNMHATGYDRMYLAHVDDPEGGAYFAHNLQFLTYAAMMTGSYADAQRAATDLAQQGATENEYFVKLRFARWNEMLALPQAKAFIYLPMQEPVWHFARGMAAAELGNVALAKTELLTVQQAYNTGNVPDLFGFNNGSKHVLGVAKNVLGARIAWAQADKSGAIAMLREAVKAQDAFYYIEPPDWYAPAREALGSALLQAGDAKGAEQVFRADLAVNRRNPRSLFGLMESLKAQGRNGDATWVQDQFEAAWSHADTHLTIADLF
jgi:hypothetical protein